MAYMRLGRYVQALADLKQALGLKQMASPELWCDRWRLQDNIYGGLYATGDWLLLADQAQRRQAAQHHPARCAGSNPVCRSAHFHVLCRKSGRGANTKTGMLLGKQATEGKVKSSNQSSYRVVAFVTHGLVPGDLRGLDQPSLSMANPALTDDRSNDGFLILSEVLGLKLNADWVVLSACNTASGDVKNEEAVSGLGRAFFFAGSRRLLVSYWSVETVSARLLTTELFKRQTEHPEESKAEALRHSMLKLMNSSKDYSYPAFWAPFGLIGDAAK